LGILIAFGVGFLSALLIFTEAHTSIAHENSIVVFRRGSKRTSFVKDSETGTVNEKEPVLARDKKAEEDAIATGKPMTDIFSWKHLGYTVSIPGEDNRKLLDNVSGYVAIGGSYGRIRCWKDHASKRSGTKNNHWRCNWRPFR
jgi:ATP-binding cassette subfamily G (WHITE) protein 2 (SNQ2)